MEVSPLGQAKTYPGTPPHTTTLYFYIGLDCAATTSGDTRCSNISSSGQGLSVVNANSASGDPLLVRGAHGELGGFEMEASVISMGGAPSSGEAEVRGDAIVTFVGKKDVSIADIKKKVERMYDEHELPTRMTSRNEAGSPPFVLSNEVDPHSNVVVVMVRARADHLCRQMRQRTQFVCSTQPLGPRLLARFGGLICLKLPCRTASRHLRTCTLLPP